MERPRTYTIRENDDGSVTLVPAPGEVRQPGTPLSATNLNHMDEEIAQLRQDADSLEQEDNELAKSIQDLSLKTSRALGMNAHAPAWMESIQQAEIRALQARMEALEEGNANA